MVNKKNGVIMEKMERAYTEKVQKKIGEAVIRFKGSYDIDIYAS